MNQLNDILAAQARHYQETCRRMDGIYEQVTELSNGLSSILPWTDSRRQAGASFDGLATPTSRFGPPSSPAIPEEL